MKRALRRNPLAILGATIIALVVLVAIFAPLIAPYDPREPTSVNLSRQLAGPSAEHLFGNDENGQDLLSQVIFGSRVALTVGLSTVALSLFIGLVLGSLAGYFGGAVDEVVMRLVDIVMAFPGLLLAIAIIAVTRRPSELTVVAALSATGWAGYARLVRAEFLALREREFVLAARAIGAPAARVIVRHILPNALAAVTVQATFGLAAAVLAEAGLSFLGLGPEGGQSWGALLDQGTQWFAIAPHLALFPGLALMLLVLAFNFLGDGLRDWLDPRHRQGKA
jgi:peptide/nickel transport system permease protein